MPFTARKNDPDLADMAGETILLDDIGEGAVIPRAVYGRGFSGAFPFSGQPNLQPMSLYI